MKEKSHEINFDFFFLMLKIKPNEQKAILENDKVVCLANGILEIHIDYKFKRIEKEK